MPEETKVKMQAYIPPYKLTGTTVSQAIEEGTNMELKEYKGTPDEVVAL